MPFGVRRDTITGPSDKSSHVLEYSVSKFGRTTALKSAAGNAGTCANCPTRARPGIFPASTLVS